MASMNEKKVSIADMATALIGPVDGIVGLVNELRRIRIMIDARGIAQHGDVKWNNLKEQARTGSQLDDSAELLFQEGGGT